MIGVVVILIGVLLIGAILPRATFSASLPTAIHDGRVNWIRSW